jgi:hypothetical protein
MAPTGPDWSRMLPSILPDALGRRSWGVGEFIFSVNHGNKMN